MATVRLPVPWLGRSACDPTDVAAVLSAVGGDATTDHEDLRAALGYAAERAGHNADAATVAQAALELAVEWRMPTVERWSVAWLSAVAAGYLRLRWSTRSRDGRLRREGRACAPVTAMTGGHGDIVIGTATGVVETWSPTGSDTLGQIGDCEVTTIARSGDRVFAGGPHETFLAVGWPTPPGPLQGRSTLTASAVADGVACGDEYGRVLSWSPTRGWWERTHPQGRPERVQAVALRGAVLLAAWADGVVAEWDTTAGQHTPWHMLRDGSGGIRCATWDGDASRFAHADDPRVRDLTWTPWGLAVARAHTVELPGHTLTSDTGIRRIAALHVAGVDYLCSSSGPDLVLWNLAKSGSADPQQIPGDAVTAIGTDAAHSRVATGSRFGQLRRYDLDGETAGDVAQLTPAGHVYDLVGLAGASGADEWLVGARTGAFRWRPGKPATRVADGLCRAVAALGGQRYVLAQRREVRDQDGRTVLTMPATVYDLRYDPAGNLVVLARDGSVVAVDAQSANRRWQQTVPRSSRLVSVTAHAALVLAGSELMAVSANGVRALASTPEAVTAATPFGADLVGVRPSVELVTWGRDGVLTHTPARVTVVRAAGDRLVGAGGSRVVGFDRVRPGRAGTGRVTIRVLSVAGRTSMRVEGHDAVQLIATDRDALGSAADSIDGLSRLVLTAEAIGTRLWETGLGEEIDRARGDDPYRPVRLEWVLQGDAVSQLDDVSWELLHPCRAPLGWFADPPVTGIRLVSTNSAAPPGLSRRPTMLVLRGVHPEINEVDAAFERIVRRTRRLDVEMCRPLPVLVDRAEKLAEILTGTADIVHLWAHCNPTTVGFSARYHEPVEALTEQLCQLRPRLVVLVGCRSAALGRRLAQAGVSAVVGMRLAVYGHAVTPLVEDLTAAVLAGAPVDLAFARALRSHVDTGHPGAAAVPVVHLAAGHDPILFPRRHPS